VIGPRHVGMLVRPMRPRDTSPETHAAQLEIYRRLGASRRAQLAARMSEDTRRVTRAGIQSRHPEYTPEEVELALRRLLYGDDVFRRAWPGRALLTP
jgi:hypothetical protein